MLDELAVVIAALCVADPIMYDRFPARFEEALAEGERSVADFKPPPHRGNGSGGTAA